MRQLAALLFLCSTGHVIGQDTLEEVREEYQLALAAVEAEYDNFRRTMRERKAAIDAMEDRGQAKREQERLDAYEVRVEKLFVVAVKAVVKIRERYERTRDRRAPLASYHHLKRAT